MIKPYHLLIAFLIGALLCGLAVSYLHSQETDLEDPQIHQLKEEIGWRALNEVKLKERIKKDSLEKITLAKDVINERQKADKAVRYYAEVRKSVPHTHKDTIDFLKADTIACDEALLRLQELAAGLVKIIKKDSSTIKDLKGLTAEFQNDKKDLVKVDSLNQIGKKQLRKEVRRKARRAFFKGAGTGGAIVAILIAVF